MRLFVLLCISLLMSLPTQATELKGMYDPDKMLESFALIGPARVGTDKTGTVRKIFGEVQSDAGGVIPYEALFMMCDGTKDACANIMMRYDWYADEDDVWCAINTWEAMPEYPQKAWAGFAFDKVRLIREQFGFEGASVEPRWKFVQMWRQELERFHALTQNLPESCE